MLHQDLSDLRPFLDRLLSRSVLSPCEQAQFLGLPTRVKHVQPNQDFVALGAQVDHASFVVEGLVGRFDQNSRGERQITALYVPSDMPGLHSVVQPTATSALQALTASTVIEVPHSALRTAAARHPGIAEAFWRDCMVASMILAQWVVNVGRRSALSRLAHLLCEMACRYKIEPVDDSMVFQLPMTQCHLADATGLTPVHINRTLMQLRTFGTEFRSRRVRIQNWSTLAEVGDFDRNYLQDRVKPEERIRIVA